MVGNGDGNGNGNGGREVGAFVRARRGHRRPRLALRGDGRAAPWLILRQGCSAARLGFIRFAWFVATYQGEAAEYDGKAFRQSKGHLKIIYTLRVPRCLAWVCVWVYVYV